MKQLVFFLLLEIFFISCVQQKNPDHFTIDGKLSNLKDTIIYLQYSYGDSTRFDSAVIKNGSFSFNGKLDEPTAAMLILQNYKAYTQIFIENTAMSLQGNADSLEEIVLTGSPAEDQYVLYRAGKKQLDKEMNQASADYEKAKNNKDVNTETALDNKINELQKQKWEVVKKFIQTNPRSYVSLSILGGWFYTNDYNDLFQLFSGLDTSIQHSKFGVRLLKDLEKLKKVSTGSVAIDFTKNDVDGKPVKLSDFRGKWVLLDFWASWCGPCRAENPNVLKCYNSFKDKGFTVLGVSLDDSTSKWKKAIMEDKMPWTQVSSLQGWKDPVSQEYAVEGIPSNFLINPQGIILARNLRGDELDRRLKEVMGK